MWGFSGFHIRVLGGTKRPLSFGRYDVNLLPLDCPPGKEGDHRQGWLLLVVL